jgi:hypothetical protein
VVPIKKSTGTALPFPLPLPLYLYLLQKASVKKASRRTEKSIQGLPEYEAVLMAA